MRREANRIEKKTQPVRYSVDCSTVGIDEVGRGPLAGPVISCAAVFVRIPTELELSSLADSKTLSQTQRQMAIQNTQGFVLAGYGEATVEEIDRLNIRVATHLAMERSLEALLEKISAAEVSVTIRRILIDGNEVPEDIRLWADRQNRAAIGSVGAVGYDKTAKGAAVKAPQSRPVEVFSVVKGDGSEPVISIASILAKEARDGLMDTLSKLHPGYGWERNAGYGTIEHRAALLQRGATPVHRMSFLKKILPVAR